MEPLKILRQATVLLVIQLTLGFFVDLGVGTIGSTSQLDTYYFTISYLASFVFSTLLLAFFASKQHHNVAIHICSVSLSALVAGHFTLFLIAKVVVHAQLLILDFVFSLLVASIAISVGKLIKTRKYQHGT